jgi:putative transposase
MEIGRKRLPHEIPEGVEIGPEGEVFFITICCEPRGENQLANDRVWSGIVETVEHREKAGDWKIGLMVAMPDHLHALVGFPGNKRMPQVIRAFKAWMASCHGIRWQRDFFDHRLRSWESGEEKANYIRMNPVRAGLVATPGDWLYVLQR